MKIRFGKSLSIYELMLIVMFDFVDVVNEFVNCELRLIVVFDLVRIGSGTKLFMD